MWTFLSLFLCSWITGCMTLTQSELAHFDAYSDNVTYSISYNRKLGVNITKFESKAFPHYSTSEYDDIDTSKTVNFRVYTDPVAATEGCLKPGPMVLAFNGVPFLNVYSSTGKNAVAAEFTSFDQCEGHVSPSGTYHYHGVPWCGEMVSETAQEPDQFIGVALDGYAVYGPYNATGGEITRSQLDNCGGEDYVNDEGNTSYRYRLTRDFPYTLGCMNGKTIASLTGQYCVKPYICGENPGNMEADDELYTDCGGPWPTTAGGKK